MSSVTIYKTKILIVLLFITLFLAGNVNASIVDELKDRISDKNTKIQELDESYFGGRKKGDKRGKGVINKVPVFGK